MSLPSRIEGYAMISADGMLADASGAMPPQLFIPADQQFFEEGLNNAVAVVHGRNSQEDHPNSPRRKRLIVTRQVLDVARDPQNPNAVLWNPAGASLQQAWQTLGTDDGPLAVLGGTDVFGLFLPLYDAFHLSQTLKTRLPGGRPVFPGIPPRRAADILREAGMKPGPTRLLDEAAQASLVTWTRS